MIFGAHALIYTTQAEATRKFFRDVLGLPWVDAHDGWLIFKLPPAEIGVHPDPKGGYYQMHLMCDDVEKTMEDLKKKGVVFTQPITAQGYGRVTAFRLPDGTDMGLYQPRHPLAIALKDKGKKPAKKPARKAGRKPRAKR
jgi:predicted enzyme related to lactoylglutathione lyase